MASSNQCFQTYRILPAGMLFAVCMLTSGHEGKHSCTIEWDKKEDE